MQNNKEAFIKLLEEHRLIIYKICNSYCKNQYDRDDLAQEISYQLWKSFHHFNGSVKFSTWMYRVALNVAITFYRKTKTSESIIQLKEPDMETAMAVIKDAINNGVILIRAGLYSNCIRLLPPVVITDEQLEEGLKVLENAIAKVNI